MLYTLEQQVSFFEKHLEKNGFDYQPVELYDAVRHIMKVKGKRIRPALVQMAANVFTDDLSEALYAGLAVEVFHNSTLVHDDIMDKAELRRGIPTVHMVHGTNTAINAGNVMMAFVYKYLLNIDSAKLPSLLEVFNKATIEVMEGQQMDMNFETRAEVEEPEYIQMIKFKTSVLLAAAAQMGALLGGASQADQENMYEFGLNLGVAFQIKDDWLDTFGEQAKVGKRIGGDIVQNKKTFLFIETLKRASAAQKQRLASILEIQDAEQKIKEMLELYAELDIQNIVEQKMKHYYDIGLKHLKAVSVPESQKAQMYDLAENVFHRVH